MPNPNLLVIQRTRGVFVYCFFMRGIQREMIDGLNKTTNTEFATVKEFRRAHAPSLPGTIKTLRQIINQFIILIMLKLEYYSATICNLIKIMFNLITMHRCWIRKYQFFLAWAGVRSAIRPSHLKIECPYEKEFFYGEKIFNPLTSKSKQFYRLLVSGKVDKPSRGFIKLKEDFGLDDSTAANAFLNIKSFSSETFIKSVRFKLLAIITLTCHRLAKMSRMICVPFVRQDQERFITYFMNILSPIAFGNSLKTSGLRSQDSMKNSL